MVINQLEKLFVTSDAATIIKELEVTMFKLYEICCHH
jgi:chaperonin GroEL (HSP60 family)